MPPKVPIISVLIELDALTNQRGGDTMRPLPDDSLRRRRLVLTLHKASLNLADRESR